MKKLRIVTALFASLLSSAALVAEEDTADTTVSFNIPIVALIDITPNVADNQDTVISLTPPTNAGAGFDGSNQITNYEKTLAISSNLPNAKLKARVEPALPNGFKLKIRTQGLPNDTSIYTKTLTNADGTSNVDLRQSPIGMGRTNDAKITIDADVTGANPMPPHGTATYKVIYTLTED